jgi:hypothetical protein
VVTPEGNSGVRHLPLHRATDRAILNELLS